MNRKIICIAALITVAVIGFMVWGYAKTAGPTKAELGKQGFLTAPETLYDFGTISMANGKVDHMFRVVNPTDGDITIKNLETSCMCTTAYIVNGGSREGPFGMPGMGGMTATRSVIPARGEGSIDAVYDPAAHGPAGVGNIDRFIYATEEGGGTLRLEIKAIVTP